MIWHKQGATGRVRTADSRLGSWGHLQVRGPAGSSDCAACVHEQQGGGAGAHDHSAHTHDCMEGSSPDHHHQHDSRHNGGGGDDRQDTSAAKRFGIRSFVYSRRTPFHPQRCQLPSRPRLLLKSPWPVHHAPNRPHHQCSHTEWCKRHIALLSVWLDAGPDADNDTRDAVASPLSSAAESPPAG